MNNQLSCSAEGRMSAEEFEAKTGYTPEQDDLERVNCEEAGTIGHQSCGWCEICDRPRFECGHFLPVRMPS